MVEACELVTGDVPTSPRPRRLSTDGLGGLHGGVVIVCEPWRDGEPCIVGVVLVASDVVDGEADGEPDGEPDGERDGEPDGEGSVTVR
ncbi:hypothetical protein PF008_g33257 [Phytophthora fragariae]|uniref:Uncharacterized protein n=1 Tax=Phytophthora fragariae TaxID=53985 RepID=A0A6G0PXF3_9STRA|nr:hypothetical protein PF008_g33257 [Phytophthora fragariae]